MWYSTSRKHCEGQLLTDSVCLHVSKPLKPELVGLALLLGIGSASIAKEAPTVENEGDKITFVTSDENVQTIIQEQVANPSIDDAITKVIPNHLIFYRSTNGTHKVHKVIEISEDTEQADATQILSLSATIPVTSFEPEEPPQIDSPASGSAVDGRKVQISWNSGNRAINDWYLHVSTRENGNNLVDSGDMSPGTTSYLVDNLPQNESTVYVKLWYQVHGGSAWHNVKSTFLSNAVKPQPPQVDSPVSGSSVNSNASTSFTSTEVPYGDHLVALYNFDGDLSDTSGNGLHGTSPTPLEFKSTPEGRSTVHFDGVDDHIVLGRSSKLDFSDSKTFTIASWIRLPGTSPLFSDNDVFMNLISKYDKGIAGEYYLDLRRSGRVGLLREAAPFDKHSSNRIRPNQFSFVVGTYDGSVARVYVDGELSGSTVMGPSGSANNTDVVLGARHKRGRLENYFQGEMDKLLIYDRALTDVEILAMFKAN